MSAATVLLLCLAAPPLAVVLASRSPLETEGLRGLAIGAALAMLVAAALLLSLPDPLRVAWPGAMPRVVGEAIFRVSALSAALIPLPAALWVLTVAVTPRGHLSRAALRRTALVTLATTLAFLTESPLLLALLWIATTLLFLAALTGSEVARSRRVGAVYLAAATLFLLSGVALTQSSAPAGSWFEQIGLWLILAAVLIRKAIFPFHAWLPELFDRGRLGPAVLFSAPQMGAYVAVVLVVPRADPETLHAVAVLSLITAVHGAALAVFQRDARRACGYLFVSQSALVLAGLDCTSIDALAGSLILWISSALAFAGMGRCVLVVEARRGRLDLGQHHGGYEQMPLLAVSFLVLGLACTGFPGTLGFVGTELLVEGAVGAFPALGFAVVAASALTGLAVLRMYFSLFCGRRYVGVPMALRMREAVVFGGLAAVLLLAGIAPGPLVASRLEASEAILRQARWSTLTSDARRVFDGNRDARHLPRPWSQRFAAARVPPRVAEEPRPGRPALVPRVWRRGPDAAGSRARHRPGPSRSRQARAAGQQPQLHQADPRLCRAEAHSGRGPPHQ